jgi:hypothetical protein
MVTLDGKQIKEVTPQGIIYLDDNGEEKFIDFAGCHENYVRRMTTPEYWERHKQMNRLTDADWDDHMEQVKSSGFVADRDVTGGFHKAGGPYIEFYTKPSTRFVFASEEEFQNVRVAISRARWQTFDLS